MLKKGFFQFFFTFTLWSSILFVLILLAIDMLITVSGQVESYADSNTLPKNKVGLLLGTSQYVDGGQENLYFRYRIDAAEHLLNEGKIDVLVISGDNSHHSYNEPQMMKNELVDRGIDPDIIYLDYAGFRTLDSIVRMKAIFDQDTFTIISQPFHNHRALFIARNKDIQAIAYNAQDVELPMGIRTKIREKLARINALWDIAINTQPKFLGEQVHIP